MDSRRARGCMTDSLRTVMGWEPVRRAESAIIMDEENWMGGLGPAWEIGGRMEWRFEEEEVVGVGAAIVAGDGSWVFIVLILCYTGDIVDIEVVGLGVDIG